MPFLKKGLAKIFRGFFYDDVIYTNYFKFLSKVKIKIKAKALKLTFATFWNFLAVKSPPTAWALNNVQQLDSNSGTVRANLI